MDPEAFRQSSFVVSMIALAYQIEPSAVVSMLVQWRKETPQPTYQQVAERLATKGVTASPQRLSELILEGMGDERPPPRKPREPRPRNLPMPLPPPRQDGNHRPGRCRTTCSPRPRPWMPWCRGPTSGGI
jgi:hypothetical protein